MKVEIRWSFELKSRKNFERERKINEVNTPILEYLAVEWCGLWRKE